ncbi:MAG TPA: asparagine synthase (glutamine-hydrolyzing), partial [Steroidobacteraceae bacterium]|nr:asparagine synthase (glutamine-hydrolyzing) [Steroidobacteraceae bacterium]
MSLNNSTAIDRSLLSSMGAVTIHRGPDDEGSFVDGELLFGMRRLSIIDVAGGHQPISNEDGTVVGICNGEIYNFQRLRDELLAAGHKFKTGSDSEVAVHGYEQYGDEFLSKLDGMFGLAIWDAKRRRLIVARDRLGIKPIYYCHDGQRLAFSSEAKALLELPLVSRNISRQALSEYVSLGYAPAPYSMFADIKKLLPGAAIFAEKGKVETRTYWRYAPAIDESVTPNEWIEKVRAEMERAVREQMVSDVPLGAFLSGGIDSSAVVAFMARHSTQPVRTYSIGFKGSTGSDLYNELPFARKIAEQFATEHREIVVQPDVASLLPRLLWHMDEPMADAAVITTYLVSEFARRDVTVILSGVGGDELFGGYRRYLDHQYRNVYHIIPRWLRRSLITPLAKLLPADRHSALLNISRLMRSFLLADELSFEDRYRSFVEVFGPDASKRLLKGAEKHEQGAIEAAFAHYARGDALQRLQAVDINTQLPDDLLMLTDRMSMAVSLECRVPLLDQGLVDLSARMPSDMKIHGFELKHVV